MTPKTQHPTRSKVTISEIVTTRGDRVMGLEIVMDGETLTIHDVSRDLPPSIELLARDLIAQVRTFYHDTDTHR
jgi:hypothetical protein